MPTCTHRGKILDKTVRAWGCCQGRTTVIAECNLYKECTPYELSMDRKIKPCKLCREFEPIDSSGKVG